MNIFNKLAITACTFSLAACMGMEITSPPFDPIHKSSALNGRILGQNEVAVRTFAKDENGRRAEIANSKCSYDSAELRGELTTPAFLRLPVLQGKPTPIRMTCTNGGLSGKLAAQPLVYGRTYDSTGGLIGITVAAVSNANARGRDKWEYAPFFNVELE